MGLGHFSRGQPNDMGAFSRNSYGHLKTCHNSLRILFSHIVVDFDCTIICGYRGQVAQDKAFDEGHSKLKWPEGSHNEWPSLAVDVAPWPIRWDDRERFYFFAGYVLGRAREMGILVKFGGDWDMDFEIRDNRFDDLVHYSLIL